MVDTRRVDGKVFQTMGPETAKLRGPYLLIYLLIYTINWLETTMITAALVTRTVDGNGQSELPN